MPFKPEHFEAIIYDEAHHVSAASYKKSWIILSRSLH